MSIARDPYVVLGVSRHASASEVTRAYRRAVRATHPDIRPDDPSAAERFRDVSAAYEILGDAGRRAEHDRATAATRVVVTGRRIAYAAPPVRLGGPRLGGGFPLEPPPVPLGRPTQGGLEELLDGAAELLRRLRASGPFDSGPRRW
jgi:curved DNA-binding protein CbpA